MGNHSRGGGGRRPRWGMPRGRGGRSGEQQGRRGARPSSWRGAMAGAGGGGGKVAGGHSRVVRQRPGEKSSDKCEKDDRNPAAPRGAGPGPAGAVCSHGAGAAVRGLGSVFAGEAMEPFEFHAELFDFRNAVLEALADNGFAWLSDFGSIDLLHDVYGLEVCAIREGAAAKSMEALLRRMFPEWRYRRTFYEDHNRGELGWKVVISRDPENFKDEWRRVG